MSEDYKTFKIGKETKEVFYSQAVHTRLIGNYQLDQLSDYLMSDEFTVKALGLLIIGREIVNLTPEEVLDRLDDLHLSQSQGAEVLAWVQDKVLNFIEKSLAKLQSQIQEMMVPLTQSVHTLNGLGKEITPKPSE